jgi:hypothetical protein
MSLSRKSRDWTDIKVIRVEPRGDHRLWVEFSDATAGEYDMSDVVRETGAMIEPLRDPAYFRRVFLEFGAPTWPNGYDIAPYGLYLEMEQAGLLKKMKGALRN